MACSPAIVGKAKSIPSFGILSPRPRRSPSAPRPLDGARRSSAKRRDLGNIKGKDGFQRLHEFIRIREGTIADAIGANAAQRSSPQDFQAVWHMPLHDQVLNERRRGGGLQEVALRRQQLFVRRIEIEIEARRATAWIVVQPPPAIIETPQAEIYPVPVKCTRHDPAGIARTIAKADIAEIGAFG